MTKPVHAASMSRYNQSTQRLFPTITSLLGTLSWKLLCSPYMLGHLVCIMGVALNQWLTKGSGSLFFFFHYARVSFFPTTFLQLCVLWLILLTHLSSFPLVPWYFLISTLGLLSRTCSSALINMKYRLVEDLMFISRVNFQIQSNISEIRWQSGQ